ncbi:MAG: ketoacyl-ACP synthase III [Gammaproteobacteria bacterium]|nr:ketoacyl-ACP synthase III [Gammaproteobacteria bacterium]
MLNKINSVSIAGISTALPKNIVEFSHNENRTRSKNPTGVKKAYIASDDVCASDLALLASQDLLEKLEWKKESIDCIIFVTQTPDYLIPATACLLQSRLGLSENCIAFDVNLGCSGYLYGLYLSSSLIRKNGLKRVLLLTGDTSSKLISKDDQSVNSLFGDAVCATALEYTPKALPLHFILGTDGNGFASLHIPAGGSRKYVSDNKNDFFLKMNGPNIFLFALQKVPKLVSSILNKLNWSIDSVDFWLFHQASALVIDSIVEKIGIPSSKVITSYEEYGNTSSASIPLTITEKLTPLINNNASGKRLILVGFGAGHSWGVLAFDCFTDILTSTVFHTQ